MSAEPGSWIERAARTAEALVANLGSAPGRRVLLIGGESGSGKTSLARALVERLGGRRGCAVLSQDDWYHLGPRANEARRRADPSWRGLLELEIGGLEAAITAWCGGASQLTVPRFEGEQRTERPLDVSGTATLVVEGTFVLALPVDGLRILLTEDWRATEVGRLARGRDPIDPQSAEVLAAESTLVQAQRSRADVWVDADGRLEWVSQGG